MTSLVAAAFVGAATGAIGAEAGLAVLGLGGSDSVSWGTILYQADAAGAVSQGLFAWVFVPGLVLAILITAMSFINFGVDLLSNPHLERRLTMATPRRDAILRSVTSRRAARHARRRRPRRQLLDRAGGVRRADRRVRLGQVDARHGHAAAAQRPGRISGGTIVFDGTDITTMPEDDLRSLRWTDIATVFQSSMNALNPVVRVEGQFRDVIEHHTDAARRRGAGPDPELFDMVLIDHKFIARLSARAVRRDEATDQSGPGAGHRAALRAPRRADHRARCRRPAQHPGERPQAAGRARASPCCSSATTSARC